MEDLVHEFSYDDDEYELNLIIFFWETKWNKIWKKKLFIINLLCFMWMWSEDGIQIASE